MPDSRGGGYANPFPSIFNLTKTTLALRPDYNTSNCSLNMPQTVTFHV